MIPADLRQKGSAIDRVLGTTVDGKYRIESLLGRGGMGAVFRAVHLGTDRTVALKVIVPEYASHSDFLTRFEREARACGRLRHPNIVDVTDFGYDESSGRRIAYLVMEYLDGCSLADVLRDERGLPVSWAVDVLRQAGSAVEEAHRAGILHRDLKPDNIWLEPNRRGGYTVKVLDFGLAKLGLGGSGADAETEDSPTDALQAAEQNGTPDLTESATRVRDVGAPERKQTGLDTEEATRVRPGSGSREPTQDQDEESATAMGSIVGTPAYMSPEQCRGLALTPASDVYSLAVIAYRLLGGQLPFTGRSDALIVAHVSQTPRSLAELRRDLPKEAAAHIMRGLSKAPEDRPKSAGAFTEMLAAQAQTTLSFLEEAMLMFMQHARAFLSASVVGLSPVLCLSLFAAVNALCFVYGIVLVPRAYGGAFVVASLLMTVGPGILLVQGAVVPAVMQAVVAPLQPVDVASLMKRFQPRLITYLRAITPLLGLFVIAGLWQIPMHPILKSLRPIIRDEHPGIALVGFVLAVLLPNAPLFAMLALLARAGSVHAFQFLAAAAVVEGLSPQEAIRRSVELGKTSGALRPLKALLFCVIFSFAAVSATGFSFLARRTSPEVALGSLGIVLALAFVFLGPFSAVIAALTYLRARRALGEPLDMAFAEFERAVLPESHWKLGERERVATLIASRY